MSERRPPPGGPTGDGTDERIRALLARAVASAPAPPSVEEVRAAQPRPAPISPGRSDRAGGRTGDTASVLRAVAASIAIVVLALAGARAVGGIGEAGDTAAMPSGELPVRYVPSAVPDGLRLTDVEVPGAGGRDSASGPSPAVAVYEGGDVTVRIAIGPTDWATWATRAAGTGGAAPDGTVPPTTAPPDTAPTTTVLSTAPPSSASGSSAPSSTAPTSTTTAPPLGTTATTTVPLDVASLPSVPGIPGRPNIRAAGVRGDVGGLEIHDPTTTTVWFLYQGQLVAVDVYGLDQLEALAVVERLGPADGGRLVPAPEDGLHRVAEAGPRPAGTPAPAAVRLVYSADGTDADGADAVEGSFVVTTTRLADGHRDSPSDLLGAAVGSFGRIERWGDRRVLVDDGGGGTTLVSFVDPAGVLVTVRGPTGDLAPYVEGLEAADDLAWALFLRDR